MARKPSKSSAAEPDASHRIVVLHGKEAFLRAERTRTLRAALEAAYGEVDTVRFDGSEAAVADVLDECRSFGLMAAHKLVVVENADQLVKESSRALVERYAESPSEGATLVLRTGRWNRGKLDALIERSGVIVKCDECSAAEAVAWAGREAPGRHGVKLTREAAALLVERLGTELGRLDTEIAKLAVGAGEGGTVDAGAVAELVGRTREEEVWSIQAELLSGDAERALRHLRAILESGPRQAHIPVSFACTDLARKLHGAALGLRAGARPFDLARQLRLWGPARDAVLAAARRLEPSEARALLRACIDADRAQKSGLGRPERTLERLALRFASIGR